MHLAWDFLFGVSGVFRKGVLTHLPWQDGPATVPESNLAARLALVPRAAHGD